MHRAIAKLSGGSLLAGESVLVSGQTHIWNHEANWLLAGAVG